MEFNAPVGNQVYNFSRINPDSYMVTGQDHSLIVYKANRWQCADDVPQKLVATLGRIIEERTGEPESRR
jgi:hypothetical protein